VAGYVSHNSPYHCDLFKTDYNMQFREAVLLTTEHGHVDTLLTLMPGAKKSMTSDGRIRACYHISRNRSTGTTNKPASLSTASLAPSTHLQADVTMFFGSP
jgi:hypothetical protein